MEELLKAFHIMGEEVRQGHDPACVYKSDLFNFSNSTVSAFPNSPTAMKYKTAFSMFRKAKSVLCRYAKSKIETDNDCDFLEPAFHGYAKAEMCENHLYDTNRPPENTYDLIGQYLKQRPDDILSEYFKNILEQNRNELLVSKFESLQMSIRTKEILAAKVRRASAHSDIKRQILATLYNRLGSLYTITQQRIRAIDSFQKSYDIDNDQHDSLFGIAYSDRYKHPEKALQLINKYLDAAPECHKKYYDAYYTLAEIYIFFYRNKAKAEEYYRKGLKAEDKQLPFIMHEDTTSKRLAKQLIELPYITDELVELLYSAI
ncbi:uncharacterized protein LOC127712378 isoform X2 [Mytilus californianus]|nr:uncharacterized protein LOC127712378 isoform X2 [Mytilus californianus]XP_052074733.1 uncharacterized protein LOC127712378 isoform X2 [Mytilus californianus]